MDRFKKVENQYLIESRRNGSISRIKVFDLNQNQDIILKRSSFIMNKLIRKT